MLNFRGIRKCAVGHTISDTIVRSHKCRRLCRPFWLLKIKELAQHHTLHHMSSSHSRCRAPSTIDFYLTSPGVASACASFATCLASCMAALTASVYDPCFDTANAIFTQQLRLDYYSRPEQGQSDRAGKRKVPARHTYLIPTSISVYSLREPTSAISRSARF